MNTSLPIESVQGRELVDVLVSGVVATVSREMRGQPASMVLELLHETLARRLPGIALDEDVLHTAAARIAVGLPV